MSTDIFREIVPKIHAWLKTQARDGNRWVKKNPTQGQRGQGWGKRPWHIKQIRDPTKTHGTVVREQTQKEQMKLQKW
jgi:hypothetical protein